MRNGKSHLNTMLTPLRFCISILFWQIQIHMVKATVYLVNATDNNASFVSIYRITTWITLAEQCFCPAPCSLSVLIDRHSYTSQIWHAFLKATWGKCLNRMTLWNIHQYLTCLLLQIFFFQICFKHGQKFSKCRSGKLISFIQMEVCWWGISSCRCSPI